MNVRKEQARLRGAIWCLAVLIVGLGGYDFIHRSGGAGGPAELAPPRESVAVPATPANARPATTSDDRFPNGHGAAAMDPLRLRLPAASVLALQAHSAQAAIDASMTLPIGHPDREEILLLVGNVCRRVQQSSADAYLDDAVRYGFTEGSDLERALNRRWFNAMASYCGNTVGDTLIELAASERALRAADGAAAVADDYDFVRALAQRPDLGDAVREPGVEEALWQVLEQSESYKVVRLAAHQLAIAGVGPFAETQQLVGRSGRLTPQPDASRITEVRDAAAWLFVCRLLHTCGPSTILGLQTRWISEAHAAGGIEGMLRSQHSPVEWEAIEAIQRQLEQRREQARKR